MLSALLKTSFIISFLLFSAVSYANYPDEIECYKNNAHACLKMALRLANRGSTRFVLKAVKLADKSDKTGDIHIGLVAAALALQSDFKDDATLSLICEQDKMIEACLVASLRTRSKPETKKDLEKARGKIITDRCNNGDGYACWLSSFFYGVDDSKAGAMYLRKGCDLGNDDCCVILGDDAATKEDYKQALQDYATPCNRGFPKACEMISEIYLQQKQKDKARRFLTDKCNAGNGGACSYLVSRFIDENDLGSREKFLRKGCNSEDDDSCLMLSHYFEFKKKNGDAIVALKNLCRERENPSLCFKLGTICDKVKDQECATTALQSACNYSHGKACLGLAKSALESKNPDFQKFKGLLHQAKIFISDECQEGNNESCNALPGLVELCKKYGIE